MHRFKFGLAVAALTLVIGSSLDSHLRRELDNKHGYPCAPDECRVLLVADNPLHSSKNPMETNASLAAARRLD